MEQSLEKKPVWKNWIIWVVVLLFGAGVFSTNTSREYNPYVPTPTSATRAINSTTYTISTIRPATVYYSITISCTATIGSTAAGSVTLQYSTNGGSTWQTVSDVANSNTVTLAIVLQSVNTQDAVLSGPIPAGALVRMVSSTTGTTTVTYKSGTENF